MATSLRFVLAPSVLRRGAAAVRSTMGGAPMFARFASSAVLGDKPTVTICGGGNAAHVCVGLMGAKGLDVNIFTPLQHEVDKFASSGSVEVTIGPTKAKEKGAIKKVSTNAADVIPGSRLVIVTVPASFHENVVEAIAPYVEPGTVIGALCARGGFDLACRDKLGSKVSNCVLFGLQTLPWACRLTDFGKTAQILGIKKEVDVCTAPPTLAVEDADFREQLGSYFHLRLEAVASFTSISLANVGQLIHPGITYGRYHNWDGKPIPEKPLFYQGVDEYTSEVLQTMSDEVQAIKNAVEASTGADMSDVVPLREWLDRSYSADIADPTSLMSAFNTNNAYQGLTHPMTEQEGGYMPDFQARYLSEDVPYGLVVTRGYAELLGVPTPMMDQVITWAQEKLGKEYLVNGKLSGADIHNTRAPQRYGAKTIEEAMGH